MTRASSSALTQKDKSSVVEVSQDSTFRLNQSGMDRQIDKATVHPDVGDV